MKHVWHNIDSTHECGWFTTVHGCTSKVASNTAVCCAVRHVKKLCTKTFILRLIELKVLHIKLKNVTVAKTGTPRVRSCGFFFCVRILRVIFLKLLMWTRHCLLNKSLLFYPILLKAHCAVPITRHIQSKYLALNRTMNCLKTLQLSFTECWLQVL